VDYLTGGPVTGRHTFSCLGMSPDGGGILRALKDAYLAASAGAGHVTVQFDADAHLSHEARALLRHVQALGVTTAWVGPVAELYPRPRDGAAPDPTACRERPLGDRVLRIARFLCTQREYEDVLQADVLDLTAEYEHALRAGAKRRAAWMRYRFYERLFGYAFRKIIQLLGWPLRIALTLLGIDKLLPPGFGK